MKYTAIVSLYQLDEKFLPKKKKLMETKKIIAAFPKDQNQEAKKNLSREIAAEGLDKMLISSLFFNITIIQTEQTMKETIIFEHHDFFNPNNKTTVNFIEPIMN